jgi:hypothetical protein
MQPLLEFGRSIGECGPKGRHISHIEPRQDYMEGNPKASFHVTLDVERDAIGNPDMDKLPHEIYRVRRRDNGKL